MNAQQQQRLIVMHAHLLDLLTRYAQPNAIVPIMALVDRLVSISWSRI